MIISGGARQNSSFYAAHLARADTNERVHVAEVRGLVADDIEGAFQEMAGLASGARCKNFFYAAHLNPREGELLTEGQWQDAVDRLEHNLGLDGHARLVVEHEKHGRTHRHVVWCRVDPDTLGVVSDSFDYRKHQQTSRELEGAFGLEPLDSVTVKDRDTERPERRPRDWETFRSADTGISPQAMKAEITALWQAADSGQAFRAAIEERGYLLAKGDRRDFCIIDPAGDEHSLARRISGAKAADIRTRMGDVDREQLPTVAEARELAREAADSTGGEPDPAHSQLGTPEQPGERRPMGEPELAGGFQPEDLAPPIRAAEGHGGEPQRVTPWGDAWRAFADRAAHYAERLYALWKDESGESSMRWLHLAKDAIGLAVSRGEDEHAAVELVEDATATARGFIEHGHAPPDEHDGDLARPGGKNAEPPAPDDRPQQGVVPQVAADPFDTFAGELARQMEDVPHDNEIPEPDNDLEPDHGGPDIG